MPEWLGWTLGIIIFIVAISVSIALHEAGHMTVARLFKIPVTRFFVGFGKTAWSTNKNGTEYGVKWLPLGGFVMIEDENHPEGSPERTLLSNVAPWKRQLIFIAGPAVNIFLGVTILTVLWSVVPANVATTTVAYVNSCEESVSCAAGEAGLQAGDEIVGLDGAVVTEFEDFHDNFKETGSVLTVLRGGEEITLNMTPNPDTGKVGFTSGTEEVQRTPVEALVDVGDLMVMNLHAIASVPDKLPNVWASIIGTEERAADSPGSVIGVGRAYGDTTASQELAPKSKVIILVGYTGLVNLALGFANLLPMMPLDGGRMFIAGVDSIRLQVARIRRKKYVPTEYKWVQAMTAVTGAALLTFMSIVMIADVVAPIPV